MLKNICAISLSKYCCLARSPGGFLKGCNAGDPSLIPGLGRSPGEGIGYPTPVFSPGESHGQRSAAGYSPWGRTDTLRLHGLYSPWNSPGQNTGVRGLSLLQGIFPTQGSNPGLLHWGRILYQLSHKGSPRKLKWVAYPFSRGSSQPRNRTRVSCIAGGFLPTELSGKPLYTYG